MFLAEQNKYRYRVGGALILAACWGCLHPKKWDSDCPYFY